MVFVGPIHPVCLFCSFKITTALSLSVQYWHGWVYFVVNGEPWCIKGAWTLTAVTKRWYLTSWEWERALKWEVFWRESGARKHYHFFFHRDRQDQHQIKVPCSRFMHTYRKYDIGNSQTDESDKLNPFIWNIDCRAFASLRVCER